jgi:hypothetical protein
VLVVVCCLAVGATVVVGSVFYIAHRVKEAVVQKAQANGIDLHSLGNSDTNSANQRPLPKACSLLSKEDVSRLIGQPVERAEVKYQACEYYGPSGLSEKLAEQEAANQVQRAKTSGVDPKTKAIEVQRMLRRMGAQSGNGEAGATGSGGELPLLVVELSANGKAAMAALAFTKAIFGAASNAEAGSQGENTKAAEGKSGADVFVGASVEGLGDKAMWTPMSGLCVLKGDTFIKINPSLFPDSNAKAINVARAVISKL